MSYFLKQNEDIVTGLKRIIIERIDDSISLLNNSKVDGTSVHSVRKNIKKIRGVLRLIRFELNGIYKEENIFYRDIGKKLAGIRDSKVLIDTINKLRKQDSDLAKKILFKIRSSFYVERRKSKKIFFESGNIDEAKELFEAGKERIAKLEFKDRGFKTVYNGIKKIYKDGKEELEKCVENPKPENLHEWRKNVKYLWYHIRIFKKSWPDILNNLASELHLLSDILGDDHDLSVLNSKIISKKRLNVSKKVRALIDKTIINKQESLRKPAYVIGRKIYSESPKNFADRIDNYYNIWKNYG